MGSRTRDPHADTLIHARWVLLHDPVRVVQGTSVAITGGRITGIHDTGAVRGTCPSEVTLPHHVLMPGLINLHTHAAMSLLRGFADDLPLMEWLSGHIWPAETRHVGRDFILDGTRLACAEMLLGGITCFNDMYFFPEQVAQAATEMGIRATVGMVAMELPTAWAVDAKEYLRKGMAVREKAHSNALVNFALAPHSPYTVGDETFREVALIARREGLRIHCHIHETRHEIEESISQYGVRPLRRLERLGVAGEHLIAVHAVHLDHEDIAILRGAGAHVAHCPSSNLKLASGFAPIPELAAAGINVGLGTDGAASNNRLDLWTELRHAALNAKCLVGDPSAWPASHAIEAVTLAGARALGLEDQIGSIAAGKQADLIAVDLSAIELQPVYEPVSHLANVVSREQVSDVWVRGRRRVASRKLVDVDFESLRNTTDAWARKLRSRNPS